MSVLRGFQVSQYIARESVLHSLDARTKIVGAALIVICALAVGQPWAYLALALLLALLTLAARLPIRHIWLTYRFIALALVVGGIISAAFFPGHVLFRLGPLAFSRQGLLVGERALGQFAILIYTTGLLTMTTPPLTLTTGLQRLLGFLRRFRVPVDEIALVITLALTFLPLIQQQLDRVLSAQLARGVDFRRGTLEDRARTALSLFTPLMIANLRRAEELATAMEARGYEVGAPRTHMQEQRLGGRDVVALAAAVLVSGLTFAVWHG